MTKRRLILSCVTVGLAILTNAVRAEIMPQSEFAVGEWTGSARSGSSAEFSFCTLSRVYQSGIELSVARSQEGFFLLSLKNPAWDPSAQSDAQIAIAVDGGEKRFYNGHAISSNAMLFALLPDVGAIYSALLSTGSILTIGKGYDNWQFDLHGMHDVMTALGDCVDRQGKMSGYAVNTQQHPAQAASLPDPEMP